MSSPFSLRFLLSVLSSPGIIYLSFILAIILFLTTFLQRGDIYSHVPSHPPLLLLWLYGVFIYSFICFYVLSLSTAVSGFVWQLLSYLVLSGAGLNPFISRMHKGVLVKCQCCLHATIGGLFFWLDTLYGTKCIWITSSSIFILLSTCVSLCLYVLIYFLNAWLLTTWGKKTIKRHTAEREQHYCWFTDMFQTTW